VAGHPEEYFWRKDVRRNARAWHVIRYRSYLARVLVAGATPNGVFGAKVMWGYLHEVVAKLRRVVHGRGLSDSEVLERAFPNLRYVWIRREDRLAQAVSWARAAQTGQWSSSQRKRREPEFVFGQVQGYMREIDEHEAAWRAWFRANAVVPHEVLYEALAADADGITRGVLAHLGLSLPDGVSPTPRHTRQRDGLNDSWIARYRAMTEDRPAADAGQP
jgi:LPS sulfotransferase NodH